MFSRRRDDMLEGGLWRVLNFLGDFLKIVNGPCAGAAADTPTRRQFRNPPQSVVFQKATVKPTGRVSMTSRSVGLSAARHLRVGKPLSAPQRFNHELFHHA